MGYDQLLDLRLSQVALEAGQLATGELQEGEGESIADEGDMARCESSESWNRDRYQVQTVKLLQVGCLNGIRMCGHLKKKAQKNTNIREVFLTFTIHLLIMYSD